MYPGAKLNHQWLVAALGAGLFGQQARHDTSVEQGAFAMARFAKHHNGFLQRNQRVQLADVAVAAEKAILLVGLEWVDAGESAHKLIEFQDCFIV